MVSQRTLRGYPVNPFTAVLTEDEKRRNFGLTAPVRPHYEKRDRTIHSIGRTL